MTNLRIAIPDDYQNCVPSLACFAKLAAHQVTVFNDTLHDVAALAERLQNFDALVLTRERTAISAALLARLPNLRVISQTGATWWTKSIACKPASGKAIWVNNSVASAWAFGATAALADKLPLMAGPLACKFGSGAAKHHWPTPAPMVLRLRHRAKHFLWAAMC
jgi:hypothetical protein